MFAVLGKDIVFETVGSPRSLRTSRAFSYAKHKIVQARPLLQWVGDDLGELELELIFHVRFTKPLAQLNALYAAAADHQARALVYSNGVHKGYWVITEIEEKPEHLADDGSIIAIEVNVHLQEWVHVVDPSKPPKPATQPIAVQTVAPSPSSASSIVPGYDPLGAPVGTEAATVPTSLYTSPGYVVPGTSAITGTLPAPVGGDYTGVSPKQIVGSPS
jgi:phage protein U